MYPKFWKVKKASFCVVLSRLAQLLVITISPGYFFSVMLDLFGTVRCIFELEFGGEIVPLQTSGFLRNYIPF